MMQKHPINLCPTVEAKPRYETQPCTVLRKKVTPLYARVAAEGGTYGADYIWDHSHQWSDHAGGIKGGTCLRCGKTLKEVRVRVNPKTGQPVRRGGLARDIAVTAKDVPPVQFVGSR
jgi:hypothetical protein